MSVTYGQRLGCPQRYTDRCTASAEVRFIEPHISVCNNCGTTWTYSCIHCGSQRGSYQPGNPQGRSHFDYAGGGWVCQSCGEREPMGANASRGGGGIGPHPGQSGGANLPGGTGHPGAFPGQSGGANQPGGYGSGGAYPGQSGGPQYQQPSYQPTYVYMDSQSAGGRRKRGCGFWITCIVVGIFLIICIMIFLLYYPEFV